MSIKIKIGLHNTILRLIVLYTYGAWASNKSEENKLMIFVRKFLGKIFGSKKNNEWGYKIRPNRKLTTLFNDPNIMVTLKSQRINWAEHVWRAEGHIIRIVTDQFKEDLKILVVLNREELAAHKKHGRR